MSFQSEINGFNDVINNFSAESREVISRCNSFMSLKTLLGQKDTQLCTKDNISAIVNDFKGSQAGLLAQDIQGEIVAKDCIENQRRDLINTSTGDVSCDPEWAEGDDGEPCQNQQTGEQIAGTTMPAGTATTDNICSVKTLKEKYANTCEEMNEPAQFCCSDNPTACLFGDKTKKFGSGVTSVVATILGVATSLEQAKSLKEACRKEADQATVLNGLSVAMAEKCSSKINSCTDACGELAKNIKQEKERCEAQVSTLENQRRTTENAQRANPQDAALQQRLQDITYQLNDHIKANQELERVYNQSNNKVETCEGFEQYANKARGDAIAAEAVKRIAKRCDKVADISPASIAAIQTQPDWNPQLPGGSPLPVVGGNTGGGAADTPSYATGGGAGLAEVDLDSLLDPTEDAGTDFGEASAGGFGSVDAGSGGGGSGGGIPGGGSLAGGGAGGQGGGYAPDDKVGSTLLGEGVKGFSGNYGNGYSNVGGHSGYGGGTGKYAKKGSQFDLNKYLPGGKKDPKKAKRGLASKGEISLNVHSSIWDTISTSYKNELGSL